MELFNLFLSLSSFLGILFLLWDKVRSGLLKATFKGENLSVPKDEVREAFRRATLAEVSRISGGARLHLDLQWKKNVLEVTEKS